MRGVGFSRIIFGPVGFRRVRLGRAILGRVARARLGLRPRGLGYFYAIRIDRAGLIAGSDQFPILIFEIACQISLTPRPVSAEHSRTSPEYPSRSALWLRCRSF